jgi:hypothetical protein
VTHNTWTSSFLSRLALLKHVSVPINVHISVEHLNIQPQPVFPHQQSHLHTYFNTVACNVARNPDITDGSYVLVARRTTPTCTRQHIDFFGFTRSSNGIDWEVFDVITVSTSRPIGHLPRVYHPSLELAARRARRAALNIRPLHRVYPHFENAFTVHNLHPAPRIRRN